MVSSNRACRQLAVFRHAHTKKGAARGRGSHLSAEGVALARRVGADLGVFDWVVATPAPRTVETALAMGYAVDDVVQFACGYVPGEFEHHDQWGWERPFVSFAELLAGSSKLGKLARSDAERWLELVAGLSEGGRALVISHGGSIEPVLVACLPGSDYAAWGGPFAHCDGVLLTSDGERFVRGEFRRAGNTGGQS